MNLFSTHRIAAHVRAPLLALVTGVFCASALAQTNPAQNDTADTFTGVPVVVPVLNNDTPNRPLNPGETLAVTTPPSLGAAAVTGSTITYTPPASLGGPTSLIDTFRYQVCRILSVTAPTPVCSTASVAVTVTIAPPALSPDTFTAYQNFSYVLPVLANDIVAPQAIVFAPVGTPPRGQVSVNAISTSAGTTYYLTYVSALNAVGTDTFSYQVCNGAKTNCSNAVVTVNVVAPPVAVADTVTTEVDTPVDIPVLINDSGVDPGSLAPCFATGTTGGPPVSTNGNGQIFGNLVGFQPFAGFIGVGTYRYLVSGPPDVYDAVRSACATVTINVTPFGPPVTNPDTQFTFVDTGTTIPVLANDTNVGPNTSVTITSGPASGAALVTSNAIAYQPAPGFIGSTAIGYQVCRVSASGIRACANSTATVNVLADITVSPDSAATSYNKSVNVAVADNDIGVDRSSTQVQTQPSNGRATVNADGSIAYAPNTGYLGVDTFTYRICSPIFGLLVKCASAGVSVDVGRPVSDLALSKSVSGTVAVGQEVIFKLSLVNQGPENSVGLLTLTDELPPGMKFISIAPPDSSWACAPSGTRVVCTSTASLTVKSALTFDLRARMDAAPTPEADGLCRSTNSATVSLADAPVNSRDTVTGNNTASTNFNVLPIPPIASNDEALAIIDTKTVANIIRNDKTNVCGARLNESSVGLFAADVGGTGATQLTTNEGVFGVSPQGTVTFAPKPGYRGVATVWYSISDVAGQASNRAKLSFTVQPPSAYISNFTGGTVSILDTDKLTTAPVVATVPVPANPDGVLIVGGGLDVYVASYGAGVVTRIDGLSLQPSTTYTVGGGPLGMAYVSATANSNGALLVTRYDASELVRIDLPGTAARALAVGAQPAGIVYDAETGLAYVANRGGASVSVVDVAQWSVVATIPVGRLPAGIALHSVRKELFVADSADNTITVIDTVSKKVVGTIALPGVSPGALALSPDGQRLFVTQFYSNTVATVDTSARSVLGSFPVGANPTGIGLDFAGTRLLVANFGDNTVTVVDLADSTRRVTVPVGAGPASFGRFVVSP
jgi:YVTN family beta-propeller protein